MSHRRNALPQALPMYGRGSGGIVDAHDPFGTLRGSRWTNPQLVVDAPKSDPEPSQAAKTEPAPEPEAKPSARPAVARRIAGATAQAAIQAGAAALRSTRQLGQVVPSLRSWLEARRSLRETTPTFVRDDAKHRALINRFSGISALSESEQQAIAVASNERRIHQASTELAAEGEISPNPMFIVSGWAARIRRGPNARMQVVGFLLPGDGIAIRGCSEPHATTSIVAHTTMETVDGSQLLKMAQDDRFPGVSHAIGRLAVQDEEFLVNQIMRLSGMSAPERVAHLFQELRWRLAEVGLADDQKFELPIERGALASATGLTPRRLEGALGELKRQNAMRLRYGEAKLISPSRLSRIAAFSPPRACSCGQQACEGHHTPRLGAASRPVIEG